MKEDFELKTVRRNKNTKYKLHTTTLNEKHPLLLLPWFFCCRLSVAGSTVLQLMAGFERETFQIKIFESLNLKKSLYCFSYRVQKKKGSYEKWYSNSIYVSIKRNEQET